MDNSSSTINKLHSALPPPSFSNLPLEDQLAILQQAASNSKPALYSIASTSHQIHALALPLLMECYIASAESHFGTMSADKRVTTITHIRQWLLDQADSLPLTASLQAWDRLQKLVEKEAAALCLESAFKLANALTATIDIGIAPSVNKVMALQQCFKLILIIRQVIETLKNFPLIKNLQ